MDIFLLYLLVQADSFISTGTFLTVLSGLATGLSIFVYAVCFSDRDFNSGTKPILLQVFRWSVPIFCICLSFISFFPSTKGLATIIGGKMTIDALKSPEAKELGSAVKDAILQQLKK